MKRILFTILSVIFIIGIPKSAFADLGDFGFFGGISEGRKLPKTTELLLEKSTKSKKNVSVNMAYKEIVFVSGKPTECEGILTIKTTGEVTEKEPVGSYTVNYNIVPKETAGEKAQLTRNIVFNVNYRKEGNQIVKDYSVKSWKESLKLMDKSLELDLDGSYFDISILEEKAAGVTYYKGNISQRSVFTGDGTDKTVLESTGDIYGYTSAWSTIETHRINATVSNDKWQMGYQVRPSVGVNKTLQYHENEPMAISFSGNYKEIMENKSGLQYDIFVKPPELYDVSTNGTANIETYNTFEQLIASNLNFLKGHYAESDIKKLFSMQVLDGDPKFFLPDQAMTRGQFIKAITKAVKLPIAEEDTKVKKKSTRSKKNTATTTYIFPDVTEERAEYPYIMAAYRNDLVFGRSQGYFYIDSPIERQEAVVIILRVLGLESLGLDPTPVTSFADDNEIASWAKQEVYAAQRLGLISGDSNGNFRPTVHISKAEGAALINKLISYMREELQVDYAENIVHFAD